MSRRTMVSALAVLGLIAVIALGQPPGSGQSKSKKPARGPDPAAKKADTADAAVKAALANDPDVQVARAKVLLAEAEMAKARQAVVLKVLTLKATIQEHEAAVVAAERRVAPYASNPSVVPESKVLEDRLKLETAKAALERSMTELKLLTGTGMETGTGANAGSSDLAVQRGLLWLSRQALHDPSPDANSFTNSQAALAALYLSGLKSPAGAVPDRIRAALDKPVRLGAKGERIKFEQALEVFKKEAGLDAPVRGPIQTVATITSDGETMPVGAWLQLFEDQTMLPHTDPDLLASGRLQKGRFYVREYGILLASIQMAPADAPTLTEFWKQKQPEKKCELLGPDSKDPHATLEFLRLKRTEMSTKYGPNHPDMIALTRQIEQLEKELKDHGDQPKK